MPLRSRVHIPEQDDILLTMPATSLDDGEMVVKFVTVFGENPARDSLLTHAVLLVLESENGQILSTIDGELMTAVRASVGVASDLLASPEAKTVAIIGSGKQAGSQLDAVCSVL